MPEDIDNQSEVPPTNRPSYTDADLPVWDAPDTSKPPVVPEPSVPPTTGPTYQDSDLPIWKDDQSKS